MPTEDWAATRATFHLWTQVVGKIRMARTPLINHWWNVPLYVTPRGLTTSLIPARAGRGFQIDFDLLDHALLIFDTDGARRGRPLTAEPVADFYAAVMGMLDELDLSTEIWTMPVEIVDAIPFETDKEHHGYDPVQIQRFWRALVESNRVFTLFRSRFVGKTSPVHFFWGGLDLAETRFSGRGAPPHPGGVPHCGPQVMIEAYSQEVSSCGYWPGPDGRGQYYSYAYPEPAGFSSATVSPPGSYDTALGEFVLPYDAVRDAADPDEVLLRFLQETYEAAAEAAAWDRERLERRWSGVTP
jgi:hypothetical protein